jgi:glucosyl-3-phosphoglycerate synthase
MSFVTTFEAADFSPNDLVALKGDRPVYVVFSTFGEREADLIHDKLSLLSRELEGLVDRFFLSHRRVDAGVPERTEERALSAHGDTDIIICNTLDVPDMGVEKGKGSDMRRTLYWINTRHGASPSFDRAVVVFLDADVVPEYFGPHFVTGLVGPVLQGHDFAKAGFWRAMGRVKKFVAQPLFSLVDHPRLRGLREFSYPLSGEVAGTIAFFNNVHFWQIYGVETGINIDSCMGGYRVADVNLGLYDHEHHGDVGIQKMSFGIMRTFFKQLVDYGIIELKDGAALSDEFRACLIDEQGRRQSMEFDLSEKKYAPLRDVLGQART